MGERGGMGAGGGRLPRFDGENARRWLDARPGRCYSRIRGGGWGLPSWGSAIRGRCRLVPPVRRALRPRVRITSPARTTPTSPHSIRLVRAGDGG